jgi:hypothetical protein
MSTILPFDTSQAVTQRLPDPYLTLEQRLFHLAHHDGLQPTQQVAV